MIVFIGYGLTGFHIGIAQEITGIVSLQNHVESGLHVQIRNILHSFCRIGIFAYYVISSRAVSAVCSTGLQSSHGRPEALICRTVVHIFRCYTYFFLGTDTKFHGVFVSGIRYLAFCGIPEIFHLCSTQHIGIVPENTGISILTHTVSCHKAKAFLSVGVCPFVHRNICR